MLISTKGRYALRIMLDLAQQEPGAFIPLPAIAERQEASAFFSRLCMILPVIFVTYISRIRPKNTTAIPRTTISAAVPMGTSTIARFTKNI